MTTVMLPSTLAEPLIGVELDGARCRGVDPEMFFPERGASTTEAKALCAECPASFECLRGALERRERFGIWGGVSERERRLLRRALNRGADLDSVVHDTLERHRQRREQARASA